MSLPLFHGVFLDLIAGSWILGMTLPPSDPPSPSADTAPAHQYCRVLE
jgi:hypothetical protein